MLIDDEIKGAEQMEKQYRELGLKDPYGGNFPLFDLLKLPSEKIYWHKPHKYRTMVFLLGRKIENLVLIVRRLRDSLNLPLQEGSVETKNKRYIEIDVESFFYLSFSALDIIARLTPNFYKREEESIKSESFEKQKKWFMEHPKKDQEYSKYLSTNMAWFDDLKLHRDKLTHHHPLIIFQSAKGIVTFGTHRNEKGFINNYPVLNYVNDKASALLDFIYFYNRHFGK
jgi:hypothetical protein